MSKNTSIQWCDSTINPVMGCSGCELWTEERHTCYAGQLHVMRNKNKGFSPDFSTPKLFPGRLDEAAKWADLSGSKRLDKPWLDGLPRLIFVSDMGDALSERGAIDSDNEPVEGGEVPFPFLKTEIVDTARSEQGSHHQWLWLTKRPNRLFQFDRWLSEQHGLAIPPNIGVGTSVTGPKTLNRIEHLRKVGGDKTIRFLSVEPLWEQVSLNDRLEAISWVIVGGESSQGVGAKEFKIEWAEKLRDECRNANVAFFLKQLGSQPTRQGDRLVLPDRHGGDWSHWPRQLRVRELPLISKPHHVGATTSAEIPVDGRQLLNQRGIVETSRSEPVAQGEQANADHGKAKEERKEALALLTALARKMFEECPVWRTDEYDVELTKRWETSSGQSQDEWDKLSTGRNRLMNLIDWTKANFTRSGHTETFIINGHEKRVWVEPVGSVRGEALVPMSRLIEVVQEISRTSGG